MAEEGRLRQEQPRGVSERAYYHLDAVFEELAQVVERDAKEMSDLPRLVRHRSLYLFKRLSPSQYRVQRISKQGAICGEVLFERSTHV